MRAIPLLLAVVGLASWAQAFQDWKGFRFGSAIGGTNPADAMFGVGQLDSQNIVVAGGANDSICCQWDSVGRFYSSSTSSQGTPLWMRLDTSGTVEEAHWTWSYPRPTSQRWYDLKVLEDGDFLTVGDVGDTVFFTGTKRVSRDTVVSDTLSNLSWSTVTSQGGGEGVEIVRWRADGTRRWAHLLRIDESYSYPVGRWISHSENGDVVVAGNTTKAGVGDSTLVILDGNDSFSLPTGSRCFAFHFDSAGTGKWFASFPCRTYQAPGQAIVGDVVWLVQADSFPGAGTVTGTEMFEGWRPAVHRYDRETGAESSVFHPLGTMQGGFQDAAAGEDGTVLLQGQQSSDLQWNGSTYAALLDTVRGGGVSYVCSPFLALVDTAGDLLKFRNLHGLADAVAWKTLRLKGKGWLLVSVASNALVSWGRLYLLDDSLNVVDSSDTLPRTLGMSVGLDGRILLTGSLAASDSSRAWLSGTGTMWAGWCRLGSAASGVAPRASKAAAVVGIRQDGRALRFSVPDGGGAIAEVVGLDGSVRFRGAVDASTRLELPRGSSVCRLTRGSSAVVRTLVSW